MFSFVPTNAREYTNTAILSASERSAVMNYNNNSREVTLIKTITRKYPGVWTGVSSSSTDNNTYITNFIGEKQEFRAIQQNNSTFHSDVNNFNLTFDKCDYNRNKMSTTSSITYMIIGVAILVKISIWCCVIYKRQERRRQLLQAQQIVSSVNVQTYGPTQPRPDIAYPQQFGVDNPVMMGPSPPAYNEIYSNYSEPKLPSYDEVVRDPNKYVEQPKSDASATQQ